MPRQAENGQVRTQRKHLFQAEGICRSLTNAGNPIDRRKGLQVLSVGSWIHLLQVLWHAYNTIGKPVLLEYCQCRQQPTLPQNDAFDLFRHRNGATGKILQLEGLQRQRPHQRKPAQNK